MNRRGLLLALYIVGVFVVARLWYPEVAEMRPSDAPDVLVLRTLFLSLLWPLAYAMETVYWLTSWFVVS